MTTVGVTGRLGVPRRRAVPDAGGPRAGTVRALVRDPARFPATPGVRAARCDLPDAIDEAALAGADAVVHCAYATRETDLARARRVNEEGTRRLLEAARRAGVPRLVFVSTVAAVAGCAQLLRAQQACAGGAVRPGARRHRAARLDHRPRRPRLVPAAPRQHAAPARRAPVRRRTPAAPDGPRRRRVRGGRAHRRARPHRGLQRRGARSADDRALPATRWRLGSASGALRAAAVRRPCWPPCAAIERLRVPFPLRSESLLGLKGLRGPGRRTISSGWTAGAAGGGESARRPASVGDGRVATSIFRSGISTSRSSLSVALVM